MVWRPITTDMLDTALTGTREWIVAFKKAHANLTAFMSISQWWMYSETKLLLISQVLPFIILPTCMAGFPSFLRIQTSVSPNILLWEITHFWPSTSSQTK